MILNDVAFMRLRCVQHDIKNRDVAYSVQHDMQDVAGREQHNHYSMVEPITKPGPYELVYSFLTWALTKPFWFLLCG